MHQPVHKQDRQLGFKRQQRLPRLPLRDGQTNHQVAKPGLRFKVLRKISGEFWLRVEQGKRQDIRRAIDAAMRAIITTTELRSDEEQREFSFGVDSRDGAGSLQDRARLALALLHQQTCPRGPCVHL